MLLMMDLLCSTGIGQLCFVTVEVNLQVQEAGVKWVRYLPSCL